MTGYELRLYMRNGCGEALLGDVAVIEAQDEAAARSEAHRRVSRLPRHCFGVLYDAAGAEIWSDDSPGLEPRRAGA
jgi:hypothetical protein